MSENDTPNFEYLNHGGEWPKFQWRDLELDDHGTLSLLPLPRLVGEAPEALAELPTPNGLGGLAVAPDGALYWSDTQAHRIWVKDPCDATSKPVPCIGGVGTEPSLLNSPHGLLVHPIRSALLVADTGNHRVQLFALGSWQLLDVWGGLGTEPGQFDSPSSLSADSAGNVYIVDTGNHRVQKFAAGGNVIASFWETAHSSAPALSHPAEIAVAISSNNRTSVYVRDEGGSIFVFDETGNYQDVLDMSGVGNPAGFVVSDGSIYIGDNQNRRVLQFQSDGTQAGAALGYAGPVAALAVDGSGGLWVSPGGDAVPLRLERRGGYVANGILWGGPFGSADQARAWHRLKALGAPLQTGAQFQFFVYTAATNASPPDPQLGDPLNSFGPSWQPMPPNGPDILVGAESHFLCIGAHLSSDGLETPMIEQMRVQFNHEGYAAHLPAIYRKKSDDPALLEDFLSLFESFFNDTEAQIEALARYFDPETVPPDWLDWLADWLAANLNEDWPEQKRRRAIADAFEAYAWRGTSRGLRAAIRFQTGIDVHIEEPLLHAAWWRLAENADQSAANVGTSVLGFTTRLGAAEPQGAVVGSTAMLDQSALITQEEFGAPLFENTAHQFSVYAYRSQVGNQHRLADLRTVINRQKPAHTAFQLCIIEAHFRIGFQATLGVDTVVAGEPSPASPLGATATDMVLAGEPPGQMGINSKIGQTTRLTERAVDFVAEQTLKNRIHMMESNYGYKRD